MKFLFSSVFIILILHLEVARAQTVELQEALENPYVSSALKVAQLIQDGDVEIDQNALFSQILSRAEGANTSDRLIESELLPELYDLSQLEQRFFSLPAVDELPPISTGVRLMVAAAIVDALDQLEELGVEPTVEGMLEAVGPSLYLMLASAATEVDDDEQLIDYASVRRGGIWFFSLGWPFCCAR